MKATTKALFGAALVAIAIPASAQVDPIFMREMARTDGNPLGDNAVPTISDYTRSKIEQARHDAFIAQLALTDGVKVEPAEEASDTTVARR